MTNVSGIAFTPNSCPTILAVPELKEKKSGVLLTQLLGKFAAGAGPLGVLTVERIIE